MVPTVRCNPGRSSLKRQASWCLSVAVGAFGVAGIGMGSVQPAEAAAPKSAVPPPAEPGKNDKETKPAASVPNLRDDLMAGYSWTESSRTLLGRFETKAESEGFPGAASLFRAASRSLQLLSGQYSDSLKKLGVTPVAKPDPTPPDVKTTKENLKTLSKLLADRRTGALSDASTRQRSSSNREATKTFRFERESLTELGRFASDAADAVEKLKTGKREYFVSRPCGYVTDKLVADKCPVCKTGRDQFEKVE
jgi:rubrerythrin